jgi:hypothetical protein
MDHERRIQAAIADLESQDRLNYAATARKWEIDRSTLSRRHRGETGLNRDANSYARRQLTDVEEEVLIKHINKLSDRGLPPTPQIVKNIAEEIAYVELGPNWVSRFCRRHQGRLKSVYLCTIDHKRKIADNSHHFQHFYETVCILFIYVMYVLRLLFAVNKSFIIAARKD